jgi:hypothetical protein
MAEFNFYGTPSDWDSLLEIVFSRTELCLIPDVFYPKPTAICHRRDSKAFRQAFAIKRGLFIKGPFTVKDIALRSAGNRYYVDEVTLGPLMNLYLPNNECSADGVLLRPGWLAHQSRFWSKDRSTSFSPSPELKAAFTSLVSQFKQRLVQTEISSRVWLGEHGLQELTNGKALIFHKGKWWTFQNRVARVATRQEL